METIIYKKDRIVLFAQYADPAIHKHFAKHILVSDKPFVCLVEQEEQLVRSAVIPSQRTHSIRTAENAKMVVFFIDETSALSKQIDRTYFHDNRQHPLPFHLENEIVQLISEGRSLERIDKCVIAHFQPNAEGDAPMDPRILSVLQAIEESETLNQDIYDTLSGSIYLSKSRFLHLFKETLGIDLKNYLLLKRMEKTYQYVTERQMTITEAAITAGFSSSSHFSEACKQHYGISLTDFLKAQKR